MSVTGELCEIALDDVLPNSLDGLFIIDRDRRFSVFSDGCEQITGYPRTAVVGAQCHCHTITDCRDTQGRSLAGAFCPSMQIFRGERSSVRQRMCIRHHDGHHVWIETTYSAIFDCDGHVASVVGIVRDITENVQMEDEFRGATQRSIGMNSNDARVAYGGVISERDEETTDDGVGSLDRILTTIEKREILNALNRANGQRTLAARLLGISRSRLYRRMEALGIDPRNLGPGESV